MDESEVTHGPESSAALRHLAKRALDDSSFLTGALCAFADAQHLDEAGLATYLGCRTDDLPRLALSRRPSEGQPDTAERDIAMLTDRFGLESGRLAALLKATAQLHVERAQEAQEPDIGTR